MKLSVVVRDWTDVLCEIPPNLKAYKYLTLPF